MSWCARSTSRGRACPGPRTRLARGATPAARVVSASPRTTAPRATAHVRSVFKVGRRFLLILYITFIELLFYVSDLQNSLEKDSIVAEILSR